MVGGTYKKVLTYLSKQWLPKLERAKHILGMWLSWQSAGLACTKFRNQIKAGSVSPDAQEVEVGESTVQAHLPYSKFGARLGSEVLSQKKNEDTIYNSINCEILVIFDKLSVYMCKYIYIYIQYAHYTGSYKHCSEKSIQSKLIKSTNYKRKFDFAKITSILFQRFCPKNVKSRIGQMFAKHVFDKDAMQNEERKYNSKMASLKMKSHTCSKMRINSRKGLQQFNIIVSWNLTPVKVHLLKTWCLA